MPYASEKKRLPEHLDRRRKLTSAQKAEIQMRYNFEPLSANSLAVEYGVSKKTILLIVNPSMKQKNDLRIKLHWKDYVPTKEERNAISREHRGYKHQLDQAGLL